MQNSFCGIRVLVDSAHSLVTEEPDTTTTTTTKTTKKPVTNMTKQKETKIRVKDDVTAATGEKCSKYAFIYVAGRRLVDAAAVDGSAAGNDCIKECIDADVSYSKYALHKSPSLQPVPCNGVTLIDGETCTMHRHAMKPIGTTPSVKDEHSAYAHRLCLDCE
jgi:hypothetical protein